MDEGEGCSAEHTVGIIIMIQLFLQPIFFLLNILREESQSASYVYSFVLKAILT